MSNGESDASKADGSPHTVPSVGAQTTGAGLAAMAGIAVGGPIGSLVAAMSLPALVDAAQKSWGELTAKRRNNVINLVAQSSARLEMDADDVIATASESPESESLLAEAIQGAAETLDERKVAALALAVANGLMDDCAAVDENLVMVRALREVEAPHVRLLASLTRRGRGRALSGTNLALVAVLQRAGLANDDAHERAVEAVDERSDALEEAITRLTDRMDGKRITGRGRIKRPTGSPRARTQPRWRRTDFGNHCLAYLESAAADLGMAPMVGDEIDGPSERGDSAVEHDQ